MVNLINELRNALTAIANAIRIRTGESSTLSLSEMPNAIRALGPKRIEVVTDQTYSGTQNQITFNNVLYAPQYILINYNSATTPSLPVTSTPHAYLLSLMGEYVSAGAGIPAIFIAHYRASSTSYGTVNIQYSRVQRYNVTYDEEEHTLTVATSSSTYTFYSGAEKYTLTYFY